MRTIMRSILTVTALMAVLAWSVMGAEQGDKADKGKRHPMSLYKASGDPIFTILNINNITSWVRYDGPGNLSPAGDNEAVYPRGTGNVIYTDGVYWGAKCFTDAAKTQPAPHSQLIRVGGKGYGFGMRPGWVDGAGAAAVRHDPSDPLVHIYRIRRDYASMSSDELIRDAAEINEIPIATVTDAQVAAVKAQYEKDWQDWPVQYGAPYIDRNGNGVYDPPPPFSDTFTVDSLIAQNRDEPGIAGADPNSPADQVIWTVANDLDASQTVGFNYSEPLGLEIQFTIWGYKRTDAMGNLYFKRFRIINKGGVDINDSGTKGYLYLDSMYVCNWSDIDLGSFSDDLAGCDTTLSVGFCYNGNAIDLTFQKYGIPVPSPGYDFFAGPLVPAPGDSAVFDLKRRYDFKNLGMTSFSYFSAGSPYSDPCNRETAGYACNTGQWWKMLRGYAPLGTLSTSDVPYASGPFPEGKFPLSGDPVAHSGFLDGLGTDYSFAPGDRRILLSTGPFTMAPGDTQDVVVAFVAGLGADRLSSVAVMKFNDRFAQNTFDALFQVPKPPKAPDVKVAALDGEIILDWGSDIQRVSDDENTVSNPGAYKFEGYNIYQLPSRSSTLKDAKRVATFDLPTDPTVVLDQQFDANSGQILYVPVQFGTNNGIQRYFKFTRDYIKDINKIYNGQEYYIAVTCYSVASVPGFLPAALESTPVVLTIQPQIPFGVKYQTSYGDTIKAITKTGQSDGFVVPVVINPAVSTGHTYQVTFNADMTWNLTDKTANKVMVSNNADQNADILSPIVDGIQMRVAGAPNDAKDFLHVANASGPLTPPTYVGFSSFNDLGFPDPDPNSNGGPIADYSDAGRWGIHTGGNNSDASYTGRFKPRTFRDSPFSGTSDFDRFVPYDFEIRFTAAGGKAYLGYSTGAIIDVPFELWNIGVGTPDDPSDDHRMIPWVLDEDGSGSFHLQQIDHTCSGADNDPYTSWIYWMDASPATPGSAGYDAFVADATYDADVSGAFPFPAQAGTGDEVMARMVLVNVNGGSVSDPTWPANVNSLMPATGTVLRILSTKPNTPAVTYSFTAPAPATGLDLQKESAKTVGVYPNPYYAFNPAETNRFSRFVTFNNLPQRATFRIFNLAGQLVRRIDKNDASQFASWDLLNEASYPVASGVYIVHVDMPDIGATKILKVAIIQEQEILDSY
jgi:hypothetical protein